jgi:hypothetical protein
LTASHFQLLAFVAFHFAGLLFTICTGFVLAVWVTDRCNKSLPTTGWRGEFAALATVTCVYAASLALGVALHGCEKALTGPGYVELLDACLSNHWLAALSPAYSTFLRHKYVERWLDNLFGTEVAA